MDILIVQIAQNYLELTKNQMAPLRTTEQILEYLEAEKKRDLEFKFNQPVIEMDVSQLPEGMSLKEWLYFKNLGVGWIDSGRRNKTEFRQFLNTTDELDDMFREDKSLSVEDLMKVYNMEPETDELDMMMS